MDGRKGKYVITDGGKRGNIIQTWRAVPSHPVPDDTSRIEGSIDENSRPLEKHSVSMEVGWRLMRFIKGKWGVTQKEIELANGVKIIFPESKMEDNIIIEGSSIESVSKASDKVQSIIIKAVNSRDFDYTHFVSLPLAIHPGLVNRLFAFQNKILGLMESNEDGELHRDTLDEEYKGKHSVEASNTNAELRAEDNEANQVSSQQSPIDPQSTLELKAVDSDSHLKVNAASIPLVSYSPMESKATAPKVSSSKFRGIDKSIFIKPKTFHLTVLMLKLWNKDRVEAAAEVLQSVSSKVIDALENKPVSIRLKGLDLMKGTRSRARVVYAPVEEIGAEGRLLNACQVIIDAYVAAGLVMEKDANHELKLHATLMNARHRRKTGWGNLDYFDAGGVFELYGSEVWGDYRIREAHLSEIFAFDENGYYHCCGSIPFP